MPQDSCMSVTKNVWSSQHSSCKASQVLSDKSDPFKQILPGKKVPLRPGDQLIILHPAQILDGPNSGPVEIEDACI